MYNIFFPLPIVITASFFVEVESIIWDWFLSTLCWEFSVISLPIFLNRVYIYKTNKIYLYKMPIIINLDVMLAKRKNAE
jgi:hypothetical protein